MRPLLHYLLIGIRDCIGAFLFGWAILFFETLFTIHTAYFDAFFFIIVMVFYFFPIERAALFTILLIWMWSLFRGLDPIFVVLIIATCFIIFQSLRHRVLREETLWAFIVLLSIETLAFKTLFLLSAILTPSSNHERWLLHIMRTAGIEFSWMLLANCIIGITLYTLVSRVGRSFGNALISVRTTQRL